jgi:glycosyltransferase involved in cell wall biosynthesis
VRIAVVNLTGGGLSGGYAKYLRSLIPLIESDSSVSSTSVFLPDGVDVSGLPVTRVSFFNPAGGSEPRRSLRKAVLASRPDVVFIPTSRWMDFSDVPVVVMVRNMEPLAVPFGGNSVRDSAKNIARRFATRRACARADGIVAVSEYVSEWLSSHWHVAPERMRTIYHGVDAPDAAVQMPRMLQGVTTDPFIFTAGSIRPARGLTDLLDAFAPIAARNNQVNLIIAGAVDRGAESYRRKLIKRAKDLGISDRVIWLGPIQAREMAWCFEHAELFVTTSRAEACPNTVLEAMAAGAHIVSGDNPPMPEFLQDCALYYKLGDAKSLEGALEEALSASPEKIARRKSLAAEIASGFTWERTAAQTISFLQSVASRRSHV